jgi:hypothetical protein
MSLRLTVFGHAGTVEAPSIAVVVVSAKRCGGVLIALSKGCRSLVADMQPAIAILGEGPRAIAIHPELLGEARRCYGDKRNGDCRCGKTLDCESHWIASLVDQQHA